MGGRYQFRPHVVASADWRKVPLLQVADVFAHIGSRVDDPTLQRDDFFQRLSQRWSRSVVEWAEELGTVFEERRNPIQSEVLLRLSPNAVLQQSSRTFSGSGHSWRARPICYKLFIAMFSGRSILTATCGKSTICYKLFIAMFSGG